jgi:hypothetical protein
MEQARERARTSRRASGGGRAQVGNFGFEPTLSSHHFQVVLPRGKSDRVAISECFTWEGDEHAPGRVGEPPAEGYLRVLLPAVKWRPIAEQARAEFNRRLLREARPAGCWTPGLNLMRRDLGKELVLLAWAIEDADPGLIPIAVANWLGLVPEERWWLYTQAAAATGDAATGRGRGWRKAVKFALTDNPVDGATAPGKPGWMLRVEQASLFSTTDPAKEHDDK